ncbi:MAG: hypothetical protein JW946_02550 [Candidatus Omnitrophica bacterium]|nr:hypothetical protein [Candidatus Omnitrophota bacterium]
MKKTARYATINTGDNMIFGKKEIVLTSKKYGAVLKKQAVKKPRPEKSIISGIKDIFKMKKKPTGKKPAIKQKPKIVLRKKAKLVSKKPEKRRQKMADKEVKEVKIGEITHFFPHVNAAVVKLKSALTEGDTVHIKGHSTDFTEQVTSMQIDNKPIKAAKKGQEIGLLVKEKVRGGDLVYKETVK